MNEHLAEYTKVTSVRNGKVISSDKVSTEMIFDPGAILKESNKDFTVTGEQTEVLKESLAIDEFTR